MVGDGHIGLVHDTCRLQTARLNFFELTVRAKGLREPSHFHYRELTGNGLKMISSPYCAVSALNVHKHKLSLDGMPIDAIRYGSHTYLNSEAFQILFPTASLIFTAAKLFHQVL